jgi:hypothetical protein
LITLAGGTGSYLYFNFVVTEDGEIEDISNSDAVDELGDDAIELTIESQDEMDELVDITEDIQKAAIEIRKKEQ